MADLLAGIPFGYDHGLKKKCVKSVDPSQANYFSITDDCTESGNWTTAVQVESTAGESCVGPMNQSLPINSAGSPIVQNWFGNSSSGYSVNLKTDFSTKRNVCSGITYTWHALLDHFFHGASSLPRPDRLRTELSIYYNEWKPSSSGATRAIVALQAEWDVGYDVDGGLKRENFLIEISFYIDASWGRAANLPPEVVVHSPSGVYPFNFIMLDGAMLNPIVHAKLATDTNLDINWKQVLEHLIYNRGLLRAPLGGWENARAFTKSTFVATEVRNDSAGVGGPVADLWVARIKNFDVDDLPGAKIEPQSEGFFKIDSTIFYSNGSTAFCAFPTWVSYLRAGGRADLTNVVSRVTLPRMRNDGYCLD